MNLDKYFPLAKKDQTIALLFHGNKLNIGYSDRERTHTKAKKRYKDNTIGYSVHAEFDALRRLPKDYSPGRITLIVFRKTAKNLYGMAKPCENCQFLIDQYRIRHRNVFFTDWNGKLRRLNE